MPLTFKLEILTPEARTFSADVESLTLPGIEGELGIYPQHTPLMTRIVPGEIAVRQEGQNLLLAVGEGFAEITPERVVVMTDMAIQAQDIDEAQAEAARRRAESRLHEKLTAEELAGVNAALLQSLAQLKVKRKQRR